MSPDSTKHSNKADTQAAIRFMLIKAAIFIGIPVAASAIAILVYL